MDAEECRFSKNSYSYLQTFEDLSESTIHTNMSTLLLTISFFSDELLLHSPQAHVVVIRYTRIIQPLKYYQSLRIPAVYIAYHMTNQDFNLRVLGQILYSTKIKIVIYYEIRKCAIKSYSLGHQNSYFFLQMSFIYLFSFILSCIKRSRNR